MPAALQLMLGMSPEQFLAEYWQRQPLLVRNALPGFSPPLSPEELAGLALEDEVESRIVIEKGSRGAWELLRGPFSDGTFAGLPATHWTLLVQSVELWVPEVRALLRAFDFLPPWRLDDIMVSYAPPGGSVGPHYDAYDVFLIQGQGQRQWQIGASCSQETPTLPGTELRILADFTAEQTWCLNPGDLLYLPPGVAHYGVAQTDCMTYSVGFRAPTAGEMLDDLATELLANGQYAETAAQVYRDPPLTPAMAGGDIAPVFVSQARVLLQEVLANEALLGDWFARYMTRPRYPDLDLDEAHAREAWLTDPVTGARRHYVNGERQDRLPGSA